MSYYKILFSIILLVLIILCLIKTETFTVKDIVSEDEMAKENYNKCLNENSDIYYKTNGKYNSCYKALNDLANSGISANEDIGYGKMKDLCPITCLSQTPSDCLNKYVINQHQVINDINKLISNSTLNDKFYHLKTGKKIKEQTDFTDVNYSNPEIIRAVNYLYLNSYPVGDKNYNLILDERKNLSIDNELNSSSNNNEPKLTSPAIIFDKNSNMNITSNKT
jgi:hypothetical protein